MKVSITRVPLRDILPNPYRQIDHYHISEEKIDALLQSYGNSGFWDGSIQARPAKKPGKYEIAFGHHRIEAAKRAGLKEVGLVIADRSNADMIRMMADENRADFKHDATVTIETVGTVIEAYGRGEIELEPVDPKTATTQTYGFPGGKPYTLGTVARFLGWIKPSTKQATNACREAFDAYHEREATHAALATLPTEQRSEVAVKTVVTAAKAGRAAAMKQHATKGQAERAARVAATKAVEAIKDQSGFKARDVAVALGKQAAREIIPAKASEPPLIQVYVRKLIARAEVEQPYARFMEEASRILPFLDELEAGLAGELATAVEAMLNRSTSGVMSLCRALRSRTGRTEKVRALLEEGR